MHSIDYTEYQRLLNKVCVDIDDDKFLPDRVVALSPNGTISGRMISDYFDVPLTNVSWGRDEYELEHNCWIAEDAVNGQQLLVVMDYTDDDVLSSFCADMDASAANDTSWEYNVRFAVILNKKDCAVDPDYYGMVVEEGEIDDLSKLFPWNSWWG